MSKQYIEQIWDDYYKRQGEQNMDISLKNLLGNFRHTLDASSKTAHAIDKYYPLDEIIHCAKEEGYFEFAESIFVAKNHIN
jgi:hypothetical protein